MLKQFTKCISQSTTTTNLHFPDFMWPYTECGEAHMIFEAKFPYLLWKLARTNCKTKNKMLL